VIRAQTPAFTERFKTFHLNPPGRLRNIERVPSPFTIAFTTLLAYLLGGIPFGYWFVRLSSGKDIRTMGSGNIGATNVHRTAGGKAGVIVLLLDILKGFLAVYVTALLTHSNVLAIAFSTIAVVLGHCYPVFLRFRGGKAVACFVGAFLYVAPFALAIISILFVLVVWLSKYISLGSILGAVLFPLVLWRIYSPSPPILWAALLTCALIIYRHKANIVRLARGQENVFSLRRSRTP
jgi:acyl phosphate:glycerol-3-phosphate acyltransferase